MEALQKKNAKTGIVQVFQDADLRSGHDGLTKLAKKHGIATGLLEAGSFVVFINSRKDKVKIFAANNTISYTKSPSGRLQMEAISKIPTYFGGQGFVYDKVLKDILEGLLKKA